MFKAIIKRTVPPGKETDLLELVTELRIGASGQEGYISGETLRSSSNPNEYIVISVWDSEPFWLAWLADEKRIELQAKIDALLGTPTTCETYVYPHVTPSA